MHVTCMSYLERVGISEYTLRWKIKGGWEIPELDGSFTLPVMLNYHLKQQLMLLFIIYRYLRANIQ